MSDSRLRIAVLYPELLGTYGDGGNVLVLRRRLQWRGGTVEEVRVPLGRPAPAECDLYLLGGGEDVAQLEALSQLRRGSGLRAAVARDAPVLAVCAGFQILGTTITDRTGRVHRGLGLLDAHTTARARRAVHEVMAVPAPELGLPTVLGFENHLGATRLGADARPLASVVVGTGNGAPASGSTDGSPPPEGALQGSIVATYLHGPVLARNPALADLLLARALGVDVSPLDPPDDDSARADVLARLQRASARTRVRARLQTRLGRWRSSA